MQNNVNICFSNIELIGQALKVAANIHPTVEGYRLVEKEGCPPALFFYWFKPKHVDERLANINWFPYKVAPEVLAHFVKGWLESVDYGCAKKHDGSNVKGFQLMAYETCYDYLNEEKYGSGLMVEPRWFVFGK